MDFGGNGLAAIVYDTDASFDVARLHQLLLTRLSLVLPYNMEMTRRLAEESLRRLHIFRPTSTLQLATSLLHLPSYHRTHMPDHEIGLVAVDSVSAFYWPARFIEEQMRNIPQVAQGGPDPSSVNPLQHVLTALGRLRLSHAPSIILTNWGLNLASGSSGPVTFYKQHLHPFPMYSEDYDANTLSSSMLGDLSPTPAPLPLTHHITLSRTSIPPFALELSIPDAIHQEVEYRRCLIQKGEIMGLVRTTGSRGISRLTFCITPENVDIGCL
jgi:DNA-repair protein XRCC2